MTLAAASTALQGVHRRGWRLWPRLIASLRRYGKGVYEIAIPPLLKPPY